MKWMRTKKTLNTQIDEDIATLVGDLRRVRADLAGRLRAKRRRESTVVAAGEPEVREVETEVRERPAPPDEYAERPRRRFRVLAIRQHPVWLRVLGASFALGAAVAFFLMRRRAVLVAEVPRPRRWRRLIVLPSIRRSRRAATRTEAYEPTVQVTPSPDREVTAVPEKSPAE